MSRHIAKAQSSYPTITLTGGSGGSGLSSIHLSSIGGTGAVGSSSNGIFANTFFDNETLLNPHIKKYEIYEFNEDVLALSVTWKRLRDNGNHICSKITDAVLFNHITEDDKVNAGIIRDYYSKKIMMLKLLGNNKFSSYRTDLNEFIHGDSKKITDKFFGLAYYLPQFYEYDTSLDSVKSNLVSKISSSDTLADGPESSIRLTPVKRLHRKTKGTDTFQYWLKNRNDIGVLICVQPSNSLIKLWEHIFNKGEEICIKGQFGRRNLDNFEYLSTHNWDIVYG